MTLHVSLNSRGNYHNAILLIRKIVLYSFLEMTQNIIFVQMFFVVVITVDIMIDILKSLIAF